VAIFIVQLMWPVIRMGLFFAQWFCLCAGALMLLMAAGIHSWLGAAESLVFLAPGLVLTALRRVLRGVRV
jgi:hypothetical protein